MDAGLLIVRLVVGLTMAAHGAQKLFGWFGGYGLTGTGSFMEQLGFRPAGRRPWSRAWGSWARASSWRRFPDPGGRGGAGRGDAGGGARRAPEGRLLRPAGWLSSTRLVLGAVALALAFTGPGAFSVDRALGFDWSGVVWGLTALVAGLAGGTVPLVARSVELRKVRA